MVKTIDLMVKVLQQHKLAYCIPYSVNKKTEEKTPKNQGKGHVLTTIYSSPDRWMFGARLRPGFSKVANKRNCCSLAKSTYPSFHKGKKSQ
jgi:hypothetical protein